MKGDFTRFTNDPKKNYTRVLKQQGRADLDADFNEQVEISLGLERAANSDVIGLTGTPKGDGFKIDVTPDASDLTIQPGRYYVDGILAEFRGNTPISYRDQPDSVPLPALTPTNNRTDLVYLEVWERHITALEDPSIREVALGGADTTTRVKTVSQVKLQTGVGASTCDDPVSGWPPPPSGGRLSTGVAPPGSDPNPCAIPPGGGYRGLENRLYRVEIHTGGPLATARFKWSRDNGAVVNPIIEFRTGEPNRIQVARLGRDKVLSLKENDWVEVSGDQTELAGSAGTLAQIVKIDPGPVLTLDRPVDSHKSETHPKVRRWDQASDALDLAAGSVIDLEDGVQVSFSGSNFKVGDHWVFTARVGDAGLEILTNAPPRNLSDHHYARLALITWTQAGSNFTGSVQDCRDQFPPLTHVCAEDVCFENSVCDFPKVTNVQEAIDALCQRQVECCSLVATPDVPGWESIFNQIQPGKAAHICFPPGEYRVSSPVTVTGKGPLTLSGAGESSKIIAEGAESALVFQNCGGMVVRDLSIRAQKTGFGTGAMEHLRGALAFRDCWNLLLENLTLSCAGGSRRAAACLSVHGDPTRDFQVVIEKCRFKIGVEQVGALLVNVSRSMVRNNVIDGTDAALNSVASLLEDPVFRAGVRKRLIGRLQVGQIDDVQPFNVTTNLGGLQVAFLGPSSHISAWKNLVAANPLPAGSSVAKVRSHLRKLADGILLQNNVASFQSLRSLILQSGTASSQGVTVAGTRADDVQILENSISRVMQGIHVGLSQHGPRTAGNVKMAGRVAINGNALDVRTALGATGGRHGVFVGNCRNLVVRNNQITLQREPGTAEMSVEGVRVFGYFGRLMMIRENYIDGFNTGIVVEPRGKLPNSPLWMVTDNLTAKASLAVKASPPVNKSNNVS